MEETSLDFASAKEADWLPILRNADAAINCIGVLQDSLTDTTAGAHVHGLAIFLRAGKAAGLKRIVHLSAVGIDRAAPTAFSKSKAAGESLIREQDLDWVILRPSVVIGPPAYG